MALESRPIYYSSLVLVVLCSFIFVYNEANQEQYQLMKMIIKSRSLLPTNSLPSDSMETETPSPAVAVVYDVWAQDGMMEADKIKELPGQPDGVDFDHYSGYVTVDKNNGRALFYYFVESPHNSSTNPLLLWVNGVPGCSNLAYGAMHELGPFRVNKDGRTLTRNKHAWNNVANVIFLESSAGVGLSYSNTSSDYRKNGDKRTVDDTYSFLINWLERFPQYRSRDLYIAGKNYAGHYVPELALRILENNKLNNTHTSINLRGVSIGNGYIEEESYYQGYLQYVWSHALISDRTYAVARSKCSSSADFNNEKCFAAINTTFFEIGSIDQMNIYAPVCFDTSTGHESNVSTNPMGDYDPCSYKYVDTYLNIPDVLKALHANVTSWTKCSSIYWSESFDKVLPAMKQLIKNNIRLWLYSGDVDMEVPVTTTRLTINMLHLSVKTPWHPWYLKNEVGGYVEEYDGLTLATIRGAGHKVPFDQPERALTMISSFLKGEVLPSS